MSYSSNSRAIEPFKLLSESFAQVRPIYLPLLLLAVPATILSIGEVLTRKPQSFRGQISLVTTTTSSIFLTFSLIATTLLFGGTFLLAYRYVKQGTMDVSGSVRQGLLASAKIFFGGLVYGLAVLIGAFLLIIPGIYLSVVLAFFPYAILSENCSLADSFKYSLDLVKGRWWKTFGSLSVQILPIIPVFVISYFSGIFVGDAMGNAESKQVSIEIACGIIGTVLLTFIVPMTNLYNAKLYSRLQETMDRPPSS